MRFDLTGEAQAKSLMVSLWPKVLTALNAGKHLTLEIKTANKSREQEEKYHAMIGEIAKQASHLGAKWDAEDWKRLLVDQFIKDINVGGSKIIPSLDGTGIVQLGFQTRKFTKEQATEFVEFLLAWGAEHGITYSQV
jgi:hypothetical protein